jgi:hypothetical protein
MTRRASAVAALNSGAVQRLSRAGSVPDSGGRCSNSRSDIKKLAVSLDLHNCGLAARQLIKSPAQPLHAEDRHTLAEAHFVHAIAWKLA